MNENDTEVNYVKLTAVIASAYISNNAIAASDLPRLLIDINVGLKGLSSLLPVPTEDLKPAVPIKKSVTPEYLTCLDDGLKFRSLKRHLAGLGMTPEQYRQKWSLPSDYPMVAPSYAAHRSELAKKFGLGRKSNAPSKGKR